MQVLDVFIDEPCQWEIRVPKEGTTQSTKTAVTFSIEAIYVERFNHA